MDNKIPKTLIKFGRKDYMENMLENGIIHFSNTASFRKESSDDLINDSYEGCSYSIVSNIYLAKITNTGLTPFVKFADKGINRLTNDYLSSVPISCFYGYDNNIINTSFSLPNYDQTISSLGKDYDTALFIVCVKEFLRKISNTINVIYHNVEYTDDTFEDAWKEPKNCNILFYKRKKFCAQHEFRLALPKQQIKIPKNYEFGSLKGLAFTVPVSCLKLGFIIYGSKRKADDYYANHHHK